MTRINSAINVESLTDEHLLAEHREIKRLPACYAKSKVRNAGIPSEFCLGPGHVKFFFDKFGFTLERYKQIFNECQRRGFSVRDYSGNWKAVEDENAWSEYSPTDSEKDALMERISERICGSKKHNFHYMGKTVTKEMAIKILIEKNVNK